MLSTLIYLPIFLLFFSDPVGFLFLCLFLFRFLIPYFYAFSSYFRADFCSSVIFCFCIFDFQYVGVLLCGFLSIPSIFYAIYSIFMVKVAAPFVVFELIYQMILT